MKRYIKLKDHAVMVKLPYAVGDRIYRIELNFGKYEIIEYKVCYYNVYGKIIEAYLACETDGCPDLVIDINTIEDEFSYTREEAEEKLKEWISNLNINGKDETKIIGWEIRENES